MRAHRAKQIALIKRLRPYHPNKTAAPFYPMTVAQIHRGMKYVQFYPGDCYSDIHAVGNRLFTDRPKPRRAPRAVKIFIDESVSLTNETMEAFANLGTTAQAAAEGFQQLGRALQEAEA